MKGRKIDRVITPAVRGCPPHANLEFPPPESWPTMISNGTQDSGQLVTFCLKECWCWLYKIWLVCYVIVLFIDGGKPSIGPFSDHYLFLAPSVLFSISPIHPRYIRRYPIQSHPTLSNHSLAPSCFIRDGVFCVKDGFINKWQMTRAKSSLQA